jgi:hypothetical protein
MSKHTPGPWTLRINKNASGVTYTIGADSMIAEDAEVTLFDFFLTPRHLPSGECEANARLIVAAPDLLAALVAVCDRSDELCKDRDAHRSPELEPLYQQCRAAIARATGEQP